jgi:WD40 repeat protein
MTAKQWGGAALVWLWCVGLVGAAPPMEAPPGGDWQELAVLKGPAGGVTAVAFSADGSLLAVADLRAVIHLWDVAAGKEKAALKGHREYVLALAFSADGKGLTSAAADGTLKAWDLATNRERAAGQIGLRLLAAAAISPDGKSLATTASTTVRGQEKLGGQVQRWDLTTGKQLGTLPGHPLDTARVAFAPDGKRLLSGGSKPGPVQPGESSAEAMVSEAKVWDLGTGKEVFTVRGGSLVAVWSPDGKRLATEDWEKNTALIRVYDAATGKELAVLRGQGRDPLNHAAFSPDGKLLATAGADKTVRLWDAAAGKELAVLKGHKESVAQVHFSPDGKVLAAAAGDGTVRLWKLKQSPGER